MARAGNFRERALFERLTDSDGEADAMGNVADGWVPLFRRWADLVERLGKEDIEAGAQSDVVTGTLRVRRDSDTAGLTSADRVTVRGDVWNIQSVVQVDRKGTLLELRVTRGIAT